MASGKTVRLKRPSGSKKTASYRRRTFMFDKATDAETDTVRGAIRATTASEAVRYAMRKVAELMRHVKGGGKVYIDTSRRGKKSTVALDIPPAV